MFNDILKLDQLQLLPYPIRLFLWPWYRAWPLPNPLWFLLRTGMKTGNVYPSRRLVTSLFRTCICSNYWDQLAVCFPTFHIESLGIFSLLTSFDGKGYGNEFCKLGLSDNILGRHYSRQTENIYTYSQKETRVYQYQVRKHMCSFKAEKEANDVIILKWYIYVSSPLEAHCPGADPGFWFRGGEIRRGVWGPPRSPVRSRAEPWWGGPGGRSPPEAAAI